MSTELESPKQTQEESKPTAESKAILNFDIDFDQIIKEMQNSGLQRYIDPSGIEIIVYPADNGGVDQYFLVNKTEQGFLGRGKFGSVFISYPITKIKGSYGVHNTDKAYALKEVDLLTPKQRLAFLAMRIKGKSSPDKEIDTESVDFKEFTKVIEKIYGVQPGGYTKRQVLEYLVRPKNIIEFKRDYDSINIGLSKELRSGRRVKAAQENELIREFYDGEKPIEFENDYRLYHMMEYLPGDSVLVRDFSEYTFLQKVNLAIQLAINIEDIHGDGVVHFDPSRGNVLVGSKKTGSKKLDYPRAGIIDFGMAYKKEEHFDQLAKIPRSYEIKEGKTYHPPETYKYDKEGKQRQSPQQAGPKTDIYMLAASLEKIFENTQDYPANPDIDIKNSINSFIQSMRNKDYEQRPDSATVTRFFTAIYSLAIHQDRLNELESQKQSHLQAGQNSYLNRFKIFISGMPVDQEIAGLKQDILLDKTKLLLIENGFWTDEVFREVLLKNQADKLLCKEERANCNPNSYDFANNIKVCETLMVLFAVGLFNKEIVKTVLNTLSHFEQDSRTQTGNKQKYCKRIIDMCHRNPFCKEQVQILLKQILELGIAPSGSKGDEKGKSASVYKMLQFSLPVRDQVITLAGAASIDPVVTPGDMKNLKT